MNKRMHGCFLVLTCAFVHAITSVAGTGLPDKAMVKVVAPYSTSSEYSKVALFLPIMEGTCTNTGSYTVSLRQQSVEITAIKIPDHAPLKPVDFTKTVHLGDTVTLEIRVDTAYYNYTGPIIWRHNGRLMPFWNSQHQSIHSVLKEDEGVYEFYQSEAERLLGKVGLMRLIVRECDPLIWGLACSEHCPVCENGGECDQARGECICPPGFKGKYCEHACEESWFDAGCTSRCGSPDEFGTRTCSSYMFCLQDPYGCSCSSGFHGIHCNDACGDGYYGAGCRLKCRCAGGKACNPVTGQCANGCQFGYSGDSCQTNDNNASPLAFFNSRTNPGQPTDFVCALQMSKKPLVSDCVIQEPDGNTVAATGTFINRHHPYKWNFYIPKTQLGSYNCIFKGKLMASTEIKFFALPRLKDAPEAVEVGSCFVLIKWNQWIRFYDHGDGPIKGYRLYAQHSHRQSPREFGFVPHVGNRSYYMYNATNLQPHTNYTFNVKVSREGLEGTGQQGVQIRVETKCDASKLSSQRVEVMATHANSVLFRWKSTPCSGDMETTLSHYEYQFDSSRHFKSKQKRAGTEDGETHTEDGLSPFTQYYFRVRPVLSIAGTTTRGQWSHTVNVQTSESMSSKPEGLELTCSDLNSITLAWDKPEHPNGLIDQYEIKYGKTYESVSSTIYRTNLYNMDIPDMSESGSRYVTQEVKRANLDHFELRIDKLEPNSTFYFKVRAKNGYGEGEWTTDAIGRTEYSPCNPRSNYSGLGGVTTPSANLAVIAAIFVGIILTITIIVAAAIGYFGINCGGGGGRDKDSHHHNGVPYTLGTLDKRGGGHCSSPSANYPLGHPLHPTSLHHHNHKEMIEQTYLSNSDCGLRLSNYHQETDSLINEAINSPQARSDYSGGGNLTLPNQQQPMVANMNNHRGSTGITSGFSTMRVHHSPGKITRIPVGPGSLDQPDFFERRAPDGNENNSPSGDFPVGGGMTLSRRREEKKLSFADQVSVRGRDRFDSSQHDESNNSSIRSECVDLNNFGGATGGASEGIGGVLGSHGVPPRSPTGSMQGIMVDFSSRPSSVTPPPLLKQNSTLQAQVSNDSSCLIVTPTHEIPSPHPNVMSFGHAPYNPNTIRAMEKKRSLDSQTFYRAK
ncbi:angiopoietin-1 receptor-like isoform X2 [Convolutriloba macropyga]|uniref:angiopoietin-1 receptor-like isoform X2 n=1 Tax=Convolutriloba macropyga TaxID=536237 RepID=UPI003F525B16